MGDHNFSESLPPKCPHGYILRDGYTTKNGTYVPPRCIRKTGIFPGKAEVVAQRITRRIKKEEENALKNVKKMCEEEGCKIESSCPKGEILRAAYKREAYTRKNGSHVDSTIVAPSCIKNRGAPGKGRRQIVLNPEDDILSFHGYEDIKDKSEMARHRALNKAFKYVSDKKGEQKAFLYLIRALIGRSNYFVRTNPEVHKIMRDDAEWISSKYAEYKKQKGITN